MRLEIGKIPKFVYGASALAVEEVALDRSRHGFGAAFRLFHVEDEHSLVLSVPRVIVRVDAPGLWQQGDFFSVYAPDGVEGFNSVNIGTRFASAQENLPGRVAVIAMSQQHYPQP